MALPTQLLQALWTTAGLNLIWRKTLYRQLCKIGSTPDYPFDIDFFGLKYQGNLNNSIEANIFFYGAFEKPLLFFMRDILQHLNQKSSPSTFVDIGANIGQHSLFMSNIADHVIAFEPYEAVSSKLKHHISLNGITNITFEEIALSDQQELLEFFAPTGRNKGIGSFDASTADKGNVVENKLQLIKGDHYFERNKPHSIELIKIDVEGFEKKVLSGLQNTLKVYRPVLVCEISYGKQLSFSSSAELRSLLPDNYELYRFNTRNTDGSKARKRGSKVKRSGFYEIIPFEAWRGSGQDDIIAVPTENVRLIPGLLTKLV
jgi:FkbM family methyltransferase